MLKIKSQKFKRCVFVFSCTFFFFFGRFFSPARLFRLKFIVMLSQWDTEICCTMSEKRYRECGISLAEFRSRNPNKMAQNTRENEKLEIEKCFFTAGHSKVQKFSIGSVRYWRSTKIASFGTIANRRKGEREKARARDGSRACEMRMNERLHTIAIIAIYNNLINRCVVGNPFDKIFQKIVCNFYSTAEPNDVILGY